MPLFAEKLKTDGLGSLTVVAPDQGGIDRAGDYAKASGQNDIIVIENTVPKMTRPKLSGSMARSKAATSS